MLSSAIVHKSIIQLPKSTTSLLKLTGVQISHCDFPLAQGVLHYQVQQHVKKSANYVEEKMKRSQFGSSILYILSRLPILNP